MAKLSPSEPPRKVALTYEDLRATPDDGCRYELLQGGLSVTPAPTTTHQRISRNLAFILHTYVSAHALGEVLYAPVDVILDASTVVEPDLVFVSSARAALTSERGIEGAPDLVVEILSPSTAARDLGVKRELYARHGVPHYWCVDPSAQLVIELVLRADTYVLRSSHELPAGPLHSALFPELAIDLAQVFPAPPH